MIRGSRESQSLEPWAALVRERVRARMTGNPSRPVQLGPFAIEQVLGAGGMGVVYAATDTRTGDRVAVKTLRDRQLDVGALQREFRAAADLSHPNLLPLYELRVDHDGVYFSMRLMQGQGLLSYLRPEGAHTPTATVLSRLSEVVPQLLDGLRHLHEHGRVHGDVKPDNCIVDPDGRLVLLDFGLSLHTLQGFTRPSEPSFTAGAQLTEGAHVTAGAQLAEGAHVTERAKLAEGAKVTERAHVTALPDVTGGPSADDPVGGTPHYMPPETLEGAQPTAFADYYALGVIIHEALAGHSPWHDCPDLELLQRKRGPLPALPPDRPVPAEIDRLWRALLAPDPRARPGDAAIRDALGARPPARAPAVPNPVSTPASPPVSSPVSTPASPPVSSPPSALPFVGRERELEQLASLADASRGLRHVVVEGPPGIGKTTLVRRFVRTRSQAGARVWRSRCYERESVPFQAFEGIVRELGAFVREDPGALLALPERELGALAQVFPALRLPPTPLSSGAPDPGDDVIARLRRAARALRGLLRAAARGRPLILWIDDLQWGDLDSASMLGELLAEPTDMPLTLIASCRSESWTTSPCLSALYPRGSESRRLDGHMRLQALPPEQAQRLTHIAQQQPGALALEVAVHTQLDLHHVLAPRIDALSAPARELVHALCLARGPLQLGVALEVSGASGEGPAVLNEVRTAHLVRTDGTEPTRPIEAYHDRIRESLVRTITPDDACRLHLRLARALERHGGDRESLFAHYHGAGEDQTALHHARRGAQEATEGLAFGRAARLLRGALDLVQEPVERGELQRELGDALRRAGRGVDAADAYLTAAAHERSASISLELRLLAARELLHAGYLPRGEALFDELLRELGMRLPSTAAGALVGLLWNRARIARGLGRREIRPGATIAARDTLRMRASWSAAQGLYMIDIVRGAKVASDNFVDALRTGDAYNLAGSYATEATTLACRGTRFRARVAELHELADRTAEHTDNPHAPVWLELMRAVSCITLGEVQEGAERCLALEPKLLDRRLALWSELSTCRSLLFVAWCFTGDFDRLRDRAPDVVAEALARGHVYDSVMTRFATSTLALVDDDPVAAEAELQVIDRDWPGTGYQLANHHRFQCTARTLFYQGRYAEALRHVEEVLPRFRRSMWGLVQTERITVWGLRGVAAVGVYRSDGGRRALTLARDAIAQLRRQDFPSAPEIADGLEAVGDPRRAAAQYLEAAASLEPTRPVHAAAMQLRAATLQSDQALRDRASTTMRARGIRNVDAFGRIYTT